ncbi:predicted protein [Histoplasma capsulatum H143]|uniref:Uncharacterized protein n=1 Tax=Ajellomyces capsulatus (strain H143) TaxID=544712 RepID=C6HF73_AJECH|nr:predicted protein [Histoplasma capsulatum H143]
MGASRAEEGEGGNAERRIGEERRGGDSMIRGGRREGREMLGETSHDGGGGCGRAAAACGEQKAVPRITFRLLMSALGQRRVSGGRNKVSNAVSTVKYTTVVNFTANFLAGPASYAWPSLCGTGLVTYR